MPVEVDRYGSMRSSAGWSDAPRSPPDPSGQAGRPSASIHLGRGAGCGPTLPIWQSWRVPASAVRGRTGGRTGRLCNGGKNLQAGRSRPQRGKTVTCPRLVPLKLRPAATLPGPGDFPCRFSWRVVRFGHASCTPGVLPDVGVSAFSFTAGRWVSAHWRRFFRGIR